MSPGQGFKSCQSALGEFYVNTSTTRHARLAGDQFLQPQTIYQFDGSVIRSVSPQKFGLWTSSVCRSTGQRKAGPERSQSCPEADRRHDGRIRSRQISRHLHRGREKADRRQGEETETPGAAAQACPQQCYRSGCRPAGELGAKEAEEMRRCLTLVRSAAIYRGRHPRRYEPAPHGWRHRASVS
jgi:hypothetical protein